MIDAIYASKLYRASKRKDKIHAAFMNQSNADLVTQLSSYLDEEYRDLAQPKNVTDPNASVSEDTPQEDQAQDTASSPSSDHSSHSSHSHGVSLPPSLDPGLGDDFNPEENLLTLDDADFAAESESSNDGDPESSPAEAVEESESVYGCTDVADRIELIKGTLNGREDTKGVERIQVKDNEMWLYYNDDTNLNNIMTNVIEYLNAAGYTDLEFNRLARTDNAIVFVINSVHELIKAVEPVEGKEE